MALTFSIDTSNNKAEAFISFIKTLDFIKISNEHENNPFTKQQKLAIDEGIKSLDEGKKLPHNKVIEQFKSIYPNYFK
jgi:hypothetical protein